MPPKTCSRCRKPKPLTDFYKKTASPDGHQNICKECTAASARDGYRDRALTLKGSLKPYRENWAEGGRRCTRCQRWKIWAEFNRLKAGHNGYAARCRSCVKEAAEENDPNLKRKRTRAASPSPTRPITLAEHNRIAQEQRGQCAVCPDASTRLVPDYDPATGLLRQLLCVRCHGAVQAIDTPGLLDDLRAYVELHKEVGERNDNDQRHREAA